MKSLLHKVNQLVQEEKILKREKERRGENYNVFEVMNAQRDEVYTHSAIIASLLNPKCNHGCKSTFLKIFVDHLKDNVVFEHLYDGTIKTEIMNNVKEICEDLEGIDL